MMISAVNMVNSAAEIAYLIGKYHSSVQKRSDLGLHCLSMPFV